MFFLTRETSSIHFVVLCCLWMFITSSNTSLFSSEIPGTFRALLYCSIMSSWNLFSNSGVHCGFIVAGQYRNFSRLVISLLIWRSWTVVVRNSGSFHPLLKVLPHFLHTSYRVNEPKCSVRMSIESITAFMNSLSSERRLVHALMMWASHSSTTTSTQFCWHLHANLDVGRLWICSSSEYKSISLSFTCPSS